MSRPIAKLLKPTIIDIIATIAVDISKGADGLLCKNGILLVRII